MGGMDLVVLLRHSVVHQLPIRRPTLGNRVIASLGPYWTTGIITLPGAAPICRGPYRYLRRNYLIVTGEIVALPLVFGEVWVALIFSVLNAMLLAWRIDVEEGALRERMMPQTSVPSGPLPPQGRRTPE